MMPLPRGRPSSHLWPGCRYHSSISSRGFGVSGPGEATDTRDGGREHAARRSRGSKTLSWSHPFVLVTGRDPAIIPAGSSTRIPGDGPPRPPAPGCRAMKSEAAARSDSVGHFKACRPARKIGCPAKASRDDRRGPRIAVGPSPRPGVSGRGLTSSDKTLRHEVCDFGRQFPPPRRSPPSPRPASPRGSSSPSLIVALRRDAHGARREVRGGGCETAARRVFWRSCGPGRPGHAIDSPGQDP